MKSKRFYLPLILLLSCLLLLLPAACNRQQRTEQQEEAAGFAIEKEYNRGPVVFRVKVDKTEITIAGKINMVLEVTAPNDYMVGFPELYGVLANQFTNVQVDTLPSKVLDKDNILMTQTCRMEPLLSGEYTIPPLNFKYWTVEDTEDNAHLLETEELKITVKSILPADLEQLSLKDIAGPVLPPPPDLRWLIILVSALLVTGGGGTILIIWLHKRRQRRIAASYITAHDLAFRQLGAMVAMNFIERQLYKVFYICLSNILRHYIENRFGLHAPESTTEEFLYQLKDSHLFGREQKDLLKEFLKHCDLVKFAELIPANAQIQSSFDNCKQFILDTQAEEAKVVDTGDYFSFLRAYGDLTDEFYTSPREGQPALPATGEAVVSAVFPRETESQDNNDDQI